VPATAEQTLEESRVHAVANVRGLPPAIAANGHNI
jgi:hypothetical protein